MCSEDECVSLAALDRMDTGTLLGDEVGGLLGGRVLSPGSPHGADYVTLSRTYSDLYFNVLSSDTHTTAAAADQPSQRQQQQGGQRGERAPALLTAKVEAVEPEQCEKEPLSLSDEVAASDASPGAVLAAHADSVDAYFQRLHRQQQQPPGALAMTPRPPTAILPAPPGPHAADTEGAAKGGEDTVWECVAGVCDLPSLQPFAGDLDFDVSVVGNEDLCLGAGEVATHPTPLQQQQQGGGRSGGRRSRASVGKQQSYVFTPQLNKLYSDMMTEVPLRLHCLPPPPPPSAAARRPLFVRCLPVYSEGSCLLEPVLRCPAHSQASHASNRRQSASLLPHVVRALHPLAQYLQSPCAQPRYSVRVPLSAPSLSAPRLSVLVNYQFACMNTCVGGVARRRLALLFLLEDAGGRVLGRRLLHLKVCKCPHRDANIELARWLQANPSQQQPPSPPQQPTPPLQQTAPCAVKRRASREQPRQHKRTLRQQQQQLAVAVSCEADYRLLVRVRDYCPSTKRVLTSLLSVLESELRHSRAEHDTADRHSV